MEHEQPELAADLPVIALLGLFDLRQVRLQLLVAEERRAVDALHRLIARIAFPVRVRGVEQLERLEPAARRHVRSHAEIDEQLAVLDRVDRDVLLSLGFLLDQLDLQAARRARGRTGSLRRAATSAARRRNRPRQSPSSSSRLLRGPRARTAAGPRSRRRSPRRSADRCRTAPRGRAALRPQPADGPCCGGKPSVLRDP